MRIIAHSAFLLAIVACNGRSGSWDTPPPGQPMHAFGLRSAAVVLDDPLHRAVALRPHAAQTLDRSDLTIGHQFL